MSRLNTPTTIDAAPTATHTSLKAVEKQLGRVEVWVAVGAASIVVGVFKRDINFS
jgi:uncharacterized membrane protein